ncbi:hypothetical protein [Vibrio coralliirubri]|uniref:hypothetical protein n=1 Tax=Vibrio coralliirubri TaxID=1516159 RepID=UPI000A3B9263|nr:hypothetical protein [Vibrio coralliirubri]
MKIQSGTLLSIGAVTFVFGLILNLSIAALLFACLCLYKALSALGFVLAKKTKTGAWMLRQNQTFFSVITVDTVWLRCPIYYELPS